MKSQIVSHSNLCPSVKILNYTDIDTPIQQKTEQKPFTVDDIFASSSATSTTSSASQSISRASLFSIKDKGTIPWDQDQQEKQSESNWTLKFTETPTIKSLSTPQMTEAQATQFEVAEMQAMQLQALEMQSQLTANVSAISAATASNASSNQSESLCEDEGPSFDYLEINEENLI